MKLKKRFPLNSSLPEFVFRHNQAIREAADLYRQLVIDIIFSTPSKEKGVGEVQMAD